LAISPRIIGRDCSSVTGRFRHGPRDQAWDRAIRRIGGQLGVVERVPSRLSLFLPSVLKSAPVTLLQSRKTSHFNGGQTPGYKMDANIFISWSGDRAKKIALALHSWLPDIIHHARPWMSEVDIDPGARWAGELAVKLESMKFGIICLTPETSNSPWVLFESGALAKVLKDSIVCPYLFEMPIENLREGPLTQFNAVTADEQGTRRLIRAVNKSLESNFYLSEERLEKAFDKWWPDLKQKMDLIPKGVGLIGGPAVGSERENLGLDFVYKNRGPALEKFSEFLEAEIARAGGGEDDACISFVSTSMRGFLVPAIARYDAEDILKKAVAKKCKLRIMMVHPDCADIRAKSEHRDKGQIQRDIQTSLSTLRTLGVDQASVRYYKMGPTVFGIATSNKMLLNPYPSVGESQRCFSLIVHKTKYETDIYQQYKQSHFDDLWTKDGLSEPIPDTDWSSPKQ